MKIAVANVKGGVGKSTIANLLSQYLKLPIKEYDEFQDGSIFRPQEGLTASGQDDKWIADTGGYLGKELEKVLKEADVVVVPLQPSPRDFVPTVSFLEWLLAFYEGKVLVVANRVANEKEAKEIKESLEKTIEDMGTEIRADMRFGYLPNLKSIQTWDLERTSWIDLLKGKYWNRSQRKAAEYVRDFCETMKLWIEGEENE